MPKRVVGKVANQNFSFEIDKVASQSNGVLVQCSGTVLLCTCVVGEESCADFLPFSVNYVEKFSSVNKFPGGYKRRELAATDQETLIARSIDRALRAIVPKSFKREIQLTVQVLSFDGYSTSVLGIAGGCVALNLAGISKKKVAAARINEEKVNSYEAVEGSDLLQAVCDEKVVMLEFGAKEKVYKGGMLSSIFSLKSSLSNSVEHVLQLQKKAKQIAQDIILLEKKILKEAVIAKGEKNNFKPDEKLLNLTNDFANEYIQAFAIENLSQRQSALKKTENEYLKQVTKQDKTSCKLFFKEQCSKNLIKLYFDSKKRLDGRKFEQLREIDLSVKFLPNLHGSSLFSRGNFGNQTQAIVSCTISSLANSQIIETLNNNYKDAFLLHYNFLPYCVYEIGRVGGVSRREIGHAELAKRALLGVMDSKMDYAVRVVSDIAASDGSSSMATLCGASLALFDAGVPLKQHVAGISVGLIENEKKSKLLLDISAAEDMFGSMDFKIAASCNGILAMQLDIKNDGLDFDTCQGAMKLAVKNIKTIIKQMKEIIKQPNEMIHATYKRVVNIDKSKIKDLIGKEGQVINALSKKFTAKIDVDKTGKVFVYGKDLALLEALVEKIKQIAS